MAKDNSYKAVMARANEIMKKTLGLDYSVFESGSVAFDYEALMAATHYTLDEINRIQSRFGVGNTPMLELRNLTALARKYAKPGYGARIFMKDEAANPSGSFKARRAACAVAHAKKQGYKGVVAATSGNYGAAVASQAAMQGLKAIIIQECYDSKTVGQPEIIEKARACEAYGAEVIQLTVGPELFYTLLLVLEETGYFNASLFSPFGIAGIETLGYEIATQCREQIGKDPDMVICTYAGGGMLTGVARGLEKANCNNTQMVGASIDLTGLHMASDTQFNKKSCTTGHTGFGVPHASDPDSGDTPRSAGRPLRYMDRFVTVKQGDIMYITEALAVLEGLERGPAGNTALAAALHLAQELPEDAVIVVSETEYTGAGKHIQPQMSFARQNGIDIRFGNPNQEDKPGVNLILPADPSLIIAEDFDLDRLRRSYLKKSIAKVGSSKNLTENDIEFLAADMKKDVAYVKKTIEELGI